MNLKYKMFVAGVINQNQSYSGRELYEMIVSRVTERPDLNSDTACELYDKYFSNNSTYHGINPNSKYFVKKQRGNVYLERDKS